MRWIILVISTLITQSLCAVDGTRLKDIVHFSGVRENQLIGYGLVVGLNKTGDTLTSNPFTEESLVSMLERLGVNIRGTKINGQNVAAVMVTADLPAFARQGSRLDVCISAIGSAKDLRGGTLLVTPLMGADGEVYAVAQGPVATGGFSIEATSASSTKGVPTSGRVANGAIVEKEIKFELKSQHCMRLALRNPDFTTAKRIADVINLAWKTPLATALDPSTVDLKVPAHMQQKITEFMAEIEQLRVKPDQIARVVIDEKNGIIVMGENVKISAIAISHGDLSFRIKERPVVSQPKAFSMGKTVVATDSQIAVNQDPSNKMAMVESSVNLQDLINGLNALGIKPTDMITILHAIKSAGALQAEIEVI